LNLRGLAASGFRDRRHTGLGDLGKIRSVPQERRCNKCSDAGAATLFLEATVPHDLMLITVELFSARRIETIEMPPNSTGLGLLKALKLAPDAHLVVRRDVPLPLDEPLADGETLTVLSVVSGGLAVLPNY
jgi:sulfur carrier protein ThiS